MYPPCVSRWLPRPSRLAANEQRCVDIDSMGAHDRNGLRAVTIQRCRLLIVGTHCMRENGCRGQGGMRAAVSSARARHIVYARMIAAAETSCGLWCSDVNCCDRRRSYIDCWTEWLQRLLVRRRWANNAADVFTYCQRRRGDICYTYQRGFLRRLGPQEAMHSACSAVVAPKSRRLCYLLWRAQGESDVAYP